MRACPTSRIWEERRLHKHSKFALSTMVRRETRAAVYFVHRPRKQSLPISRSTQSTVTLIIATTGVIQLVARKYVLRTPCFHWNSSTCGCTKGCCQFRSMWCRSSSIVTQQYGHTTVLKSFQKMHLRVVDLWIIALHVVNSAVEIYKL